MAGKAKPPMGIENFREIRTGGFYYVDKTELIKTLLENPGKVNLFTRPRRFGKTLNMSMLKYFFEAGSDVMLFDNIIPFQAIFMPVIIGFSWCIGTYSSAKFELVIKTPTAITISI